jgi:ABC-type nitrate/sulfonate/bicarbonate transport system permease component
MVRHQLAVWAIRLALLAGLFGYWIYMTGPGQISPLLLPKLDLVWAELGEILSSRELWHDVRITVTEFLAAFAIAGSVGVALGFICSRTELRYRVVEPLIAWGYMVPLVLFYPLFIVWFDIGMTSKIAYASLSGFFPIAFNSIRGFRAVDPRYLRVARAFGASAGQTDRQVKLPGAMPMVMSGIRIGGALCMITVILAEMLASTHGLGYELAKSSQTLKVPSVYAHIVVLLVFVAIVQVFINRLGKTRFT